MSLPEKLEKLTANEKDIVLVAGYNNLVEAHNQLLDHLKSREERVDRCLEYLAKHTKNTDWFGKNYGEEFNSILKG